MNDYVRMVLFGLIAIAIEILLWWTIEQVTVYADGNNESYVEIFEDDSAVVALDEIGETPTSTPTPTPTITPTPTPTPTPTITPMPVLHPETVDFYKDVVSRIESVYDGVVKVLISLWVLVGVIVGYGVVKDVFG